MPEATITDKDTCVMHTEKIHELELSMVEIKGDVKHIRERIDNGLSATISKVWDKLNTMALARADKDARIEVDVENNKNFIDKLRNALIWIAVSAVAGGVITVAYRIIHTYATKNM